ncbi:CDGSH iron-sulfur domain-containing protein [Marivibrio halodurans]|uniref:CDGSH iron-sulfur domain-containing protein n=1 Tax=Marivibrio halodurans TaxID=2039722 RepID=A0A8J7S070_9PROT|nr:CDGSH iron-sulfur domain-containing protein [Marivibrio halodurans]MBP5857885.1 CDGSH iron-sulfur domain-containing protein [Marivibrio halodurans]
MSAPETPQKAPYSVEVEAGRVYMWCACGRSARQPFCDGSHAGTGIAPRPYSSRKARTVFFCGCKRTEKPPLCDGYHATL